MREARNASPFQLMSFGSAQPVVIVMRETPLPFWSFEEED
jgi:hypothetical protein